LRPFSEAEAELALRSVFACVARARSNKRERERCSGSGDIWQVAEHALVGGRLCRVRPPKLPGGLRVMKTAAQSLLRHPRYGLSLPLPNAKTWKPSLVRVIQNNRIDSNTSAIDVDAAAP
jgi:hypothetical protein